MSGETLADLAKMLGGVYAYVCFVPRVKPMQTAVFRVLVNMIFAQNIYRLNARRGMDSALPES